MIILGIETSCDETAVAVVENGTKILANVVSSSSDLQKKYGGVYPEVAAREQAKVMISVLKEAIYQAVSVKREAKRDDASSLRSVDALAVTIGPGLIGSLLVGVETAKTLAYVLDKPIIPVNHVLAHLYANWFTRRSPALPAGRLSEGGQPLTNLPSFPALCLIVSGGHTDLLLMKGHGKYKILGQTQDDAAGEAFDKTARLLGLSYPGGPEIERIAKKGNPRAFNFPRGMIASKDFNFSFSGLKTAVLREIKKLGLSSLPSSTIYDLRSVTADMAASVQEAIVDILVTKTLKAAEEFKPKSILFSGGVAANSRLRRKFISEIRNTKYEIPIFFPPPSLCTDNAAAIASYAFFNNHPEPWEKIEVNPSLSNLI